MEIEQLDGSADVAAAHDALEEHRWQEAFDFLIQADRKGRLGASDLEALAEAAWFTAQPDLAMEAKERAFKAYLVDQNKARAAAVAFDLSREYHNKQKFSIASAWAARGERLLEGEPEGFAHAYQAVAKSIAAQHAGDVELAIRLAGRAVELGTRFDDADIRALGLLQQGRLLIAGGRTNEGFSLLEEATIAAVNGELNPFMAGVAYCCMISSCRNTTDYRRASEWTEATISAGGASGSRSMASRASAASTARRSLPCRARWTEPSRSCGRPPWSSPRTMRRRRWAMGSTR